MEDYNFENGKSEVSLVDYLGLEEDEQIEDSSGITQICMAREGNDPNTNEDRRLSDENQGGDDAGYWTSLSRVRINHYAFL